MSCLISNGRAAVCSDGVGGIQSITLLNFNTASLDLDATGMQIESWPSSSVGYFFELKANNNTFVEALTKDADAGTSFYTQTLTVNLKKLDSVTTKTLKLAAYGRPKVLVHTRQGDTFVLGAKYGTELTTFSSQTGGAMGDSYGYTGITFVGMEKDPAYFVSGATADNLFGTTTNVPTLVYS